MSQMELSSIVGGQQRQMTAGSVDMVAGRPDAPVIGGMGQPADECERLFSGERAKSLRGRNAYLLLKCREPLAERIETSVLLLERIDLALLRGKLLVLRLQPLCEFPGLLSLLFQLVGLLLHLAILLLQFVE